MSNPKVSGLDYYYNPALYGAPNAFSRSPGAQREAYIQRNLERNIAELAMNRFKWGGLPDGVDPRFLELTLLTNGMVVWYFDDQYDKVLAVRASGTGYVNFQDQYTSYTIIGPGSKILSSEAQSAFMTKTLSAYIPTAHKDLDASVKQRKGVGMYCNYFRIPEMDTIQIYSTRIATADRTLEINSKNARRNKVIVSTANTALTMTNVGRQIDEGVEQIHVKDAGVIDSITSVDLGIEPESFDKLSLLRTRWWNECMGLLGIDNANQDKKERLVSAEVGANDSQTDSMRFVALNARKQAAEIVNDVFGLGLSVEFNAEVEAQAQQVAQASGIDPNANDEDVK